MIDIVGTTTVTVRADQVQHDTAYARAAVLGSSGAIIEVGDLQWDPDLLTLSFRLGSGTAANAWSERDALIAAAETATKLSLPTGDVNVLGLLQAAFAPRPLGWQVELRFAATGANSTLPTGWDTPLAAPTGDHPEPPWGGPETFTAAVFGAARNGHAVGITPAGVSVWSVSLWAAGDESPYAAAADPDDGSVYIASALLDGSGGGRLRRLNPDDGTVIWTIDQAAPSISIAAQVAGGRLYWTTTATVGAVAKADGSALWQHAEPTGDINCVAADDTHVFYAASKTLSGPIYYSVIVRLSASTGQRDDGTGWPVDVGTLFGAIYGCEVLADGSVLATGQIPRSGGYQWVRVLKLAADGTQTWDAKLGQYSNTGAGGYSLAVAGNSDIWVLMRPDLVNSQTLIWHVAANGTVIGNFNRYNQVGTPTHGAGFAGSQLFFVDGYSSGIRAYDTAADSMNGYGYIGDPFDQAELAVSHMGQRS